MIEELEPVGDHERLLRRIHVNHYQADLPIPIQRAAFRPNPNDATGISVYRERFVLQPADVLFAVKPEKRGKFYVCRLAVQDLRKLGLTVVPDPDPNDIPGHSIIPELSAANYAREHDRLADIGQVLAILGNADIVLRPSS